MRFRSVAENVPIHLLTTGKFSGDGKPSAITFPSPLDDVVHIGGIQTVSLAKLVELKLASGMTRLARLKDVADVQGLVRYLNLDADFAERIDASFREMYLKLHSELLAAATQYDAPDRDGELPG